MRESETEFEQAVRENSTINPVRVDVGTAEGGGDPPPGVDDPPEDESPRPDELPDDDPAAIGASGGNIDFGPDHVEENEAGASDPRLTEERGTQTGDVGLTEADPAYSDASYTLDPAVIQESMDEIQRVISGVDPDDVLGLSVPSWGWGGGESDPDEDQGSSDDSDNLF